MAGVVLPQIAGLADEQSQLYEALQIIARAINAQATTIDGIQVDYTKPSGPRNVAVAQLGGKLHVTWDEDKSGPALSGYRISRATAGTRSSPTTPTFDSATQIGTVQAQGKTCPASGSYTFDDVNFTVTDYKQDDPSRFSFWVQSITTGGTFSEPVQATSSPIELLPSGQGELTQNPKQTSPNKLYNAAFDSSVTTTTTALKPSWTVSASTNATPIEITFSANHGLASLDRVSINSCDVPAINGDWQITVTAVNKATLDGSSAPGSTATTGSIVSNYPGQPALPSTVSSDGSPAFGYWYISVVGSTTPKFSSDGSLRTNEIYLASPTSINDETTVGQPVGFKLLTGGEHYTFSVYARLAPATSAQSNTTFTIDCFDLASLTITSAIFDGSLLTTSYQRFAVTMITPDLSGYSDGYSVLFNIRNTRGTSSGNDLYVRWPMVNVGDFPAIWTDVTDLSLGVGRTSSAPVFGSTPTYARAPDGHLQIDPAYA